MKKQNTKKESDPVLGRSGKEWDPVRKGKIYCSPACGGRCTIADFNRTVKGALRLVKTLGFRWRADVWENLGWHYQAKAGALVVDADNHGPGGKPAFPVR